MCPTPTSQCGKHVLLLTQERDAKIAKHSEEEKPGKLAFIEGMAGLEAKRKSELSEELKEADKWWLVDAPVQPAEDSKAEPEEPEAEPETPRWSSEDVEEQARDWKGPEQRTEIWRQAMWLTRKVVVERASSKWSSISAAREARARRAYHLNHTMELERGYMNQREQRLKKQAAAASAALSKPDKQETSKFDILGEFLKQQQQAHLGASPATCSPDEAVAASASWSKPDKQESCMFDVLGECFKWF